MSQPTRQSQEFLEAWAITVGKRNPKLVKELQWFNQGPSAEELTTEELVQVDPQAFDAEPVQVVEDDDNE